MLLAHKHPRRAPAFLLIAALIASILSLAGEVIAPTIALADPPPNVTGEGCAPGVGVTVVIDFQAEGDIAIGCAEGEQANGFDALTNAGFTFNEDGGPVDGAICQIGRIPSTGYPDCWYEGFWGYWKSNGITTWEWSQVGAGNGPLPVDSVEGWSWTFPIPADYSGAPMRISVEEALAQPDEPPAIDFEVLLQTIFTETAHYLQSTITNPGVTADDWAALGLARGGIDNPTWYDTYIANTEAKVATGSLGAITNYARTVIGLAAVGVDATDVSGENLLLPIADYTKSGASLNGAVFSLIALDTRAYDIPTSEEIANPTTREKLVQRILDAEIAGGGWAFFGTNPDPDMTSMALQALAPYKDKTDVAAAIDRALVVLSNKQLTNGGFASGIPSAESASQVIVALTALGIDPTSDARFVKAEGNVVSALAGFYVDGGGFWYNTAGTPNTMSTQQGFYGLVAYFRFANGESSLYDMSVSADNGGDDGDDDENNPGDNGTTPPDNGGGGETPTDPDDGPGSNVGAPQAWAQAAFTDLLGRAPTTAELDQLVARIEAGEPYGTIARELATSDAWLNSIINGFYQNTLGRNADSAGLAYWVEIIRTGQASVAQVASLFYASAEYYNNIGGGNDTAWITDLYRKILGREPDAAGLAYWVEQTAIHGRGAVASSIYGSIESRRDRVTTLYLQLLGRQPDPTGLAYWAEQITTHGDISLAINLVISAEYQTRALQPA